MSLPIRMSLAVRQLDMELAQRGPEALRALPAIHPAVLAGWEYPLKRVDSVLSRYSRKEFEGLAPLNVQLEVNRCHAEARLAVSRAGYSRLSDEERETLLRRAAGLLSSDEGRCYAEIACCPGFEPSYLTSTPERLADGFVDIEQVFGQPTALGYGFLLMAGVRAVSDLRKYGRRITSLFEQLARHHSVAGRLEQVNVGIASLPARERARIVSAVRDQLWHRRQRRMGRFVPLTQVVDAQLQHSRPIAGDDLGLGVLDGIILGRLGFPVVFLMHHGHVFLQVGISSKLVESWDPLKRKSNVPVGAATRVGGLDLLGEGYLRMARGYSAVRSFAHGERVAKWVLRFRPGSADAYEVLGLCILGLQRPGEAIEACEHALRLNPMLADAHLVMGNAHAMLGAWDPAIRSYRMAVKRRPGFAEAYNNLGIALAKKGQTERAVGAYNEAIRVKPDYVEAYYNLGNLYLEQEEYGEAIVAYERAVEHRPGFAGALYNLGQAHYGNGDIEKALSSYRAAVEANPKHAGAWHNLGIVYRDMGESDKAVEAIEKAVELNPTLFR